MFLKRKKETVNTQKLSKEAIQRQQFDGEFYDYLICRRFSFCKDTESLRRFCFSSFLKESREVSEAPDIWAFLERKIPEFLALKGV